MTHLHTLTAKEYTHLGGLSPQSSACPDLPLTQPFPMPFKIEPFQGPKAGQAELQNGSQKKSSMCVHVSGEPEVQRGMDLAQSHTAATVRWLRPEPPTPWTGHFSVWS